MEMIDINGTRLACYCDGAIGAPWLVVANSLAADHRMWSPQIDALGERFRVLRFDARGHGRSESTPGPYSLDELVADALGVMDAHDIDRAHFMGLSLGGMVGLGLAIGHPGRIERLVCCAAIAKAPAEYAQAWRERIASIQHTGLGNVVEGTVERWFTPDFRAAADNAGTLDAVRDMILGTSVAGYAGCAAALTELDYADDLTRIDAPVLYVAGANDVAAPAATMAEMAAETPQGQLAVLEPAAHLVNMEQPERFGELVTTWLAD